MVQETNENFAVVIEKKKVAQDRHKSFADQHRKDKEFSMGEHVLLKVSPIWGVVRFGQKRGKLSPRYIGLFEISEYIAKVAYRLALLHKLSGVHNVFHVNTLKEYPRARCHMWSISEP